MTSAKCLNRVPAYRGKVIDLTVERIALPDGAEVELELVNHPGGAAVVALDSSDRVCLLRQYRHAAGGWLWELPAGRIDPGEEPLATARRELAEEAGIVAADWNGLGPMHSSPGIFTEVIHLWLARTLDTCPPARECGELIEVHWMALGQALDWCGDGTITDGKTLVGLYRTGALLRGVVERMTEDPGC